MNTAISPDVKINDLQRRFADAFARIAETAVAREQQRELAFEAVQWLRDAGFGALRVPVSRSAYTRTLIAAIPTRDAPPEPPGFYLQVAI